MAKIRTILFGMTGFGNSALEALTDHSAIDLVAIFTTRRQEKPFPYYPCDHLYAFAIKKRIPVYEGLNLRDIKTYKIIKTLAPGLAVVSSFNQIITNDIINLPKYGVINLHPSLLPRYRGATPTVWVLMNGEEETGITAHFIEDETVDSGRIIFQSILRIFQEDTDGMLRFRLAELSKVTLATAINLVLTQDKSVFVVQDETKATYFPKRSIKDSEIDVNKPFEEIINQIRAMTPYPGARLVYKRRKYLVKSARLLALGGRVNNKEMDSFDLETPDGRARFTIGGMIQ